MADMSSLTFSTYGIENSEDLIMAQNAAESQAGQQATSPERICEVTLVKTGKKKNDSEEETRVRAETLGTAKFRRDKFWPQRY